MALQLQSAILACGTMRERNVEVGDFVEEVDLLLLEQRGRRNGVHRSVAPSLVEKASLVIQVVEVVSVGIGPQPVQASDFEV